MKSFVIIFLLFMCAAPHARAQTPGDSPAIPGQMWECEADGKTCGLWTFNGMGGLGRWQDGAVAQLLVQQFDPPAWVIIRRTDTAGPYEGLTAIYVGSQMGNQLAGTVTWTWLGHWRQQYQGTWSATIGVSGPEAPYDQTLKSPQEDRGVTPENQVQQHHHVTPTEPETPRAVAVARGYLQNANLGKEILLMMHPLGGYLRHEFLRYEQLPDGDGFRLEYVFRWDRDDRTYVDFNCDSSGHVRHIQVMQSTAAVAPFFLANLALKQILGFLGDKFLEKLKIRLNKVEQRLLDAAVDQADLKGILELQFRAEQR